MMEPARQLESLLAPYYALHHLWWRQLLAASGIAGWRRVAVQIYHSMRATSPLLLTAARESSRGGSAYGGLEAWGRAHAEEEAAHPAWFLEDLIAAGCAREEVLASVPDEEVLELVGAQFSLIQLGHPTAVLGYFFATECHPPDAAATRQQAQRLGLPPEAIRTILHHSEVDQEHKKEILQLLARYGGTPEHFRLMARGAVQYLTGWSRLFQRYHAEATTGAWPLDAGDRARAQPAGHSG